jgi:hypothetical protein
LASENAIFGTPQNKAARSRSSSGFYPEKFLRKLINQPFEYILRIIPEAKKYFYFGRNSNSHRFYFRRNFYNP